MGEVASPKRWKRAVSALCAALVLGALSTARAKVPGPPAPGDDRTLPLPAPGTHRLIRIGPQALISEDDQGKLSMVDESEPPPKIGRSLVTSALTLGLIGLGAFVTFEGAYPAQMGASPAARASAGPLTIPSP